MSAVRVGMINCNISPRSKFYLALFNRSKYRTCGVDFMKCRFELGLHSLLSSLFKVECQNNTNTGEKFDYFEETGDAFYNCMKNFMDFEAVKTEIEQAKDKAALDVVFKKYCEKEAQMKTCVRNFFDALAPCVNTTGQGQLDSAKKIADEFINRVITDRMRF